MKTITFLFALIIVISFSLPSWGQAAYQKSDLLLSGGIGVGSSIYGGASINANVEYFISDEFSLGGGIGYTGYNRGFYLLGERLRINVFYFGPRGSYHLSKAFSIENEKLDLYAGAFLGIAIATASYGGETVTGYNPGVFSYSIYGGGRYQINPKLAVYGELGLGISALQLGVSLKL